jgi:hypothetical protein
MSLCNKCMSKYKEGAAVRGCSSHEFLEIPRPEWENFLPEAVNKEDKTIDQWLDRIYMTYEDAVISAGEARVIRYTVLP